MDFTVEKYRELCRALLDHGFVPLTLESYLSGKAASAGNKRVLMRHDVDRWLHTALRMAKVETELGISSSYYFRIPTTWNPSVIREISQLSHEVGLHYEVMDKARGDGELAAEYMTRDLEKMRALAEVRTVAMHGNPRTPFDNRDFWQANDLADFGLLGESYRSVDFEDLHYFTDTGRAWNADEFNVYDRPTDPQGLPALDLSSTDDLISALPGLEKDVYLVTHPERWSANIMEWWLSWAKDFVANRLKILARRNF